MFSLSDCTYAGSECDQRSVGEYQCDGLDNVVQCEFSEHETNHLDGGHKINHIDGGHVDAGLDDRGLFVPGAIDGGYVLGQPIEGPPVTGRPVYRWTTAVTCSEGTKCRIIGDSYQCETEESNPRTVPDTSPDTAATTGCSCGSSSNPDPMEPSDPDPMDPMPDPDSDSNDSGGCSDEMGESDPMEPMGAMSQLLIPVLLMGLLRRRPKSKLRDKKK